MKDDKPGPKIAYALLFAAFIVMVIFGFPYAHLIWKFFN